MALRGENLVPPPREVPLSLTLRTLFGGFFNQFGWSFFTFGMLFMLIFGSSIDFSDHTRFRGELVTRAGTVTGIEQTSMEVNEEEVVGWVFEYQVDDQSFEGLSYTNGWDYDQGDRVQVEFPANDPSIARIVGSRRSMAPVFIIFLVAIFPTVGFLFWVHGLRAGLKARRLLARGVMARGTLTGKEPTNATINDSMVYEVTFAFQPEGHSRQFQCKARTHLTESLEDEEEEALLYSPSDPNDAVMLDALPGGAAISDSGRLVGQGLLGSLAIVTLPALGIILTVMTVVVLAT